METTSVRSINQQVDIWQGVIGHLQRKPGRWFNFAQQAKYRVGRLTREERELGGRDLSSVPTLYFHFSHQPIEAWNFYIQALSLATGLLVRYDFLFDILQNTIESVLNHDAQTEIDEEYNPVARLDFSRRDSDSLSADEAIRIGEKFVGFEALACLCQSTGLIQELANGLELTSLRIGHRHEYVPVLFSRENRIIVKAMPTDKLLGFRRAILK